MKLSPDAVLQRVSDLDLRVASDGSLRIQVEGGVVGCGSHGLGILEAFARPTPLTQALAALQPRTTGAHDWVELLGTIEALHRAGVLRDPADRPALRRGPYGFEAAFIHRAMLDDRGRTGSFLAGIRATVRPGDVVVDLGTGTGILALAAARAGAARVYAIEATGIAGIARRMFEANGLADRITLVEGWSTRVTLPERADVLVSETVGNEPFAEATLEFLSDAQRRLLKPGARMVPRRLRVFATPMTVPVGEVRAHTFTAEAATRWRKWYGFDFDPLWEAAGRSSGHFYVNPRRARTWPALADPVRLADIDFTRPLPVLRRVQRRAVTSRRGLLTGLLVHFELDTGGATITTDPRHARRDNCWLSPVSLMAAPIAVRRGDRLVVTYNRKAGGSAASCRLDR